MAIASMILHTYGKQLFFPESMNFRSIPAVNIL